VLLGGVDFSGLSLSVGDSVVTYGVFLQSIFDFMIIAFAIFMVVRLLAKLQKPAEETPVASAPTPEDIMLLREIRDSLKRG
jgi:large conductance mechanosensitive channel